MTGQELVGSIVPTINDSAVFGRYAASSLALTYCINFRYFVTKLACFDTDRFTGNGFMGKISNRGNVVNCQNRYITEYRYCLYLLLDI